MLKPFWSIMIPSYNCASLLPKAIESALACKKAFPDTQIEVVDDASPRDNPGEVAARYRECGVTFFRQPRNVGAPRNFNTCIERARGEWIHILHGDDYVRADFYEKIAQGVSSEPRARLAITPVVGVDENGNRKWGFNGTTSTPRGLVGTEFRDAIAVWNRISTPAIVVQRSAYDEVGYFDPTLVHTTDWDMWRRLTWKFDAWFEADTVAYYMEHSASDTARLARTGENLYDLLRAIKKGAAYFPPERRAKFETLSRRLGADVGLGYCRRFFLAGDYSAAAAQLKASLVLAPSWVIGVGVPRAAMRAAERSLARLGGRAVN